MRIGALTMVRAGTRATATPLMQKTIAKIAPVIQPHTTSRHLTPQTPRLPQLAPGTVTMLEHRAGADQMGARTYEEIDSAAPTSSAAVPSSVTVAVKEEKSSGIFPLALAALAAYFMG